MPPDQAPSSADVPASLFQLQPYQQEIYNRLHTLVGPGAAEFYKDACRHMVIQPPFEATTHIVSHLLREIESALRSVLKPFIADSSVKGHKQEIEAILKALGFEDADPAAQAWLELPGDHGLQDRAHRKNLDAPRQLDTDFVEFWAQMETVLGNVLDRFEAHYMKVFTTLETLAAKTDPVAADIDLFVRNTPNNLIAHQRFFNNLVVSATWLRELRAKDIFKTAPIPEKFPDGGIRYPEWPELGYLKRMATAESQVVTEILSEVDASENAVVQADLLEVAVELPLAQRVTLKEKMKEWMKSPHSVYVATASISTIGSFIDEGDVATALELSASFLEVLPDPKAATPPLDPVIGAPYEPRTHVDDWQYAEFLKDGFQKIVQADPWEALNLLSNLLSNYLEFDNANTEHEYRDSSYIFRSAIEDHEQNHMGERDGVEHALISRIRDIALNLVATDTSTLARVITALEEKKWTVFKRIVLVLLSKYPSVDPSLTAQYAANKTLFEDHEILHEYALLLGTAFSTLTPEQQELILGWIDDADEIKERTARAKSPDDHAETFKKNWQKNKLSFISQHLTGDRKQQYDALVAELGEPDHPDFSTYSTSFVGPLSATNPHSLADMDPDALIEYLKTWKQSDDRYGFGPTKEGLGRDISNAVILKPKYFEGIAERFKDMDPTYVRSYLQGFHDIDITDWEGILSLCEWVMTQPRDIEGRVSERWDQDPGWGYAKRTIASTFVRGLQKNLIPFALRERLWAVIDWLTEDPDPAPENEKERSRSYDDSYTLTINTTRGEAMEAVVQYGLWVYREIGKTENGEQEVKKGFEIMPEVKAILEKHLDPEVDPAVAIRAVYGRYLPWLHLMDKNWTEAHLEQIMPTGHSADALYQAAWSAYVIYVGAFDDILPILKSRYGEVIAHLSEEKIGERRNERNTRLIEHLMLYYMRGRIALDDELMVSFWSVAPSAMKGYALDFIGRNLASGRNKGDPLPADTLERLQALWESRIALAEASADKTIYKEEMEAFGWWFASDKFPEKWSADQYLRALAIGNNKTQIDHLVADKLLILVEALPIETIAILSKIALTERPAWILLGNKSDVYAVLEKALNSPIDGARAATEALINRLAAHGFPEFGDLLQGDGGLVE